MSAIVPAVVFELHIARSEFIDAYNAADLAVRSRLQGLLIAEKAMMGDNLVALEKVSAGPQYSKSVKKRVDALVSELREFQPLRRDVVHSRMTVLTIDGAISAMFTNVQKSTKVGRCGLILTLVEMQQSTSSMNAIAVEMLQMKTVGAPEPAPPAR